MRKSLKIILIIGAVVLLAFILLYINRNDLVSYGLRKFVSVKSDSTTTLTLEKVELDPLNGSITIYRPALYFTELYLNDNKAMKVNKLSFEKLGVYNVSLIDLLLGRSFEANKILVLKPAVHFEKHGFEAADTNTSEFTADKLLGLLNTNSRSLTGTKLKINEIEIGFGAIHLHMDSIPGNMISLVDFSLLLKRFETQVSPDISTRNRIFYSDEVIFQVKNLHKQMKGGYDLHIDSVSYNSIQERFVTSGFSMLPHWQPGEKKNKTGIIIDSVKLDGVSVAEIRGLKKLHPGALEISGATFTSYIKAETDAQKQPKPDTGQLEKLPKLLKDVMLDSLLINGLTFLNIKGEADTSLIVENIRMRAGEIRFDSTLLDNPLEKLRFDEIWLATDQVKVVDAEKGLNVGFNGLEYSTAEKQLKVNGLRFSSDSANVLGPEAVINLSSLQVGGFSLKSFLHKKKQQLSLNMVHPVVDISLIERKAEKETPPENNDNEYIKMLVLQDIDIRDGMLKLLGTDELKLVISGIDVAAHGLGATVQDSLHHLNINKLRLAIEGIDAGFSKGGIQITTEAVLLDSLNFEMNAVKGKYNRLVDGKAETASFDLNKLQLFSVDLNKLFFEKRMEVGSIVLDGPVLRADLSLPDTSKKNSQLTAPVSPLLPIVLEIGKLGIKHGRLNLGLTGETDTIRVLSDYEITLGKIVSNDSSVLSWIDHSDWQALFQKTVVTSVAYDLHAGRILINPNQSIIELKQFTLESKPNHRHKQNKFEMKRISLPALSVSGLDYPLLIHKDSIRFSKLTIDAPELNIRLMPGETAGSKASQTATFDIESLLQMAYDTIDLNNLHLKLEMSTDTSHTLVQVHNLSIEHLPRKRSGDNLMPELAVQLDEVTVSDSVKNTYLRFNDLDFDPALKKLTISDVDWMQNQEKQHAIGGTDKKSTAIHLSKIEFTGAYLKQTMPTHLGFSKLRFSDIDITVIDNEKGKSLASQELEFNISSLKQYADLLSRLTIDTTVLEDVSVHYRTVGADEQERKIEIDSIGLVVHKVQIDTNMFDQDNPVLIEDLVIDLKGRTRISSDSLYELQTGLIHYNFPKNKITIDSFYVLPRFGEAESFRRAKFQKGITRIFIKKVDINDLRVEELLNNQELHFGSIDVHRLAISIVKDKKYPIKPGTYKKMPQELIRDIAQQFQIDSVRIFNSYIYFKLYPEKKTSKPGEIMLTQFNATAYHLTNIINNGDSTTLDVVLSADIMGESRMVADFHFPLYDTANHWWFGFKTEKIDFPKLNLMTQQLVGLTIQKGKGTISAPLISGDDFNTTGTMVFRYRNIRLSLYNRKKAETETGIFSSMANFFINDLVLRSNNPKFASKIKLGHVYTERDTQKDIVNFAFRSILSGMLSTLGINKKEQRQERKVYKKEFKKGEKKSN